MTYENSAEAAHALAADLRAGGARAAAIQADAGTPAGAAAAVAGAVEALGGIDILVNNAGVARMGAFIDQALEDLDDQIDVNVRGVLLTTQAALRHLPDGGRIITIGSNVGLQVPFGGLTVYAATKSALESFTRGLARELGSRRITVNLVRPGPTETDMNPVDGPFAATVLATLPVGRYGQPDEIAGAVGYLASPAAAFVTGSGITIDGGAVA